MHASPADFRALRRDGIVLQFAVLDDIAYVMADFPPSGSRGTFAEEMCEEAHWAFVVNGDLEIQLADERREIARGTAFHIPAGNPHRLMIPGRAQLAGFTRVATEASMSDDALRGAGFELVRSGGPRTGTAALSVDRPRPERPPGNGDLVAESRRMGDLLFTRVRMGRQAGYTGEPCDLPHWGIVTSGSVAIEWEDDVEVVTAGDFYYCPPGPPAHRIQAADPAIIVDFTPIEAFRTGDRIAEWRRGPGAEALADPSPPPRVDVAALV